MLQSECHESATLHYLLNHLLLPLCYLSFTVAAKCLKCLLCIWRHFTVWTQELAQFHQWTLELSSSFVAGTIALFKCKMSSRRHRQRCHLCLCICLYSLVAHHLMFCEVMRKVSPAVFPISQRNVWCLASMHLCLCVNFCACSLPSLTMCTDLCSFSLSFLLSFAITYSLDVFSASFCFLQSPDTHFYFSVSFLKCKR